MLFKIAKKSHLCQDIFIALTALIHPIIKHNTAKIELLKAAFGHAMVENLEGSYFEFGVFEGTSLKAAATIQRAISAGIQDEFAGCTVKRKFYGFDSFEDGFKRTAEDEAHPVFSEGSFTSSYERCRERLRRFPEVSLIKGYFEDTIGNGKIPEAIAPGEKCAIAFIDCDLKSSARTALDFLWPILQPGSVVILDDAYSYKGNPQLSVFGAWQEFLASHPTLQAREFMNYGIGGKSYIVWAV
jgi:hypothetical protein